MSETMMEAVRPRELTADQVVARVRLIQQVMTAVMKKDVHYGVIPGTPKPTLYKPGAEQILVTFQIAAGEPKIEDLSTTDSIRYRVTRPGQSIASGAFLGSGVGECSSDEEKYRWRRPVCDQEYEETPEDQRRAVWKKVKGEAVQLKQVRTRPADVANTVLKMADKRAYVALALQTTAASDCFSQDLEDLPEEVRESVAGGEASGEAKPPIQPPQKKAAPAAAKPAAKEGLAFRFIPAEYDTKSGEGKNGPWVKHGVKGSDGKWYSTFNEDLGAILAEAKEQGREVTGTYTTDGKYNTIAEVAFAE